MAPAPQTTPLAQPSFDGRFPVLPLGTSRSRMAPCLNDPAEEEFELAVLGESGNSRMVLPSIDPSWGHVPEIVCEGDDPFDDFEEDDFDDDFDDDFEEDWEDDLTQDDEFPDTFGGHEEEEEDDEEDGSDTPFKDDPDFDE